MITVAALYDEAYWTAMELSRLTDRTFYGYGSQMLDQILRVMVVLSITAP